jgi:hypothetical protein
MELTHCGEVGGEVTLLVSFVVAMLLMGGSSVFEWLCCVCSQTRLGPGPRQQGRQVQEVGFPTRNEVEGGRRPVCTSAARKIGVRVKRRDCFGNCSSGVRCGQEQGA